MRSKFMAALAVLLLALPSLVLAQIGQTAVLTGTVTDSSGGVLPGVTVTVTSPSQIGGAKTAVTDATGTYRFPALAPGAYLVTMELQGFKEFKRENVRLQLGQTIMIDASLQIGGLSETVDVSGESPVVDVKTSAAQKNLTQELLENIPYASRFGPNAFYMSPGVNPNNGTAFGSGGSSSNALMIDGVDVTDPEGGTAWVFMAYNWIQEVQVVGLGAAAEYGGFTGVASNSLFRSGSNNFHGLFETLFQNQGLTGNNVSQDILDQNADLTPGKTDYITDTTVQVGGPIKKDKFWFFTSFQFYRPKDSVAGYPPPVKIPADMPFANVSGGPQARLETSPRFLFKPTIQLAPNDKLTGFLEVDQYTVDGRNQWANRASIGTLHQDSPEFSWNANYTKVLSSSMVFDVKYSGFWGYYYLTPYGPMDQPGFYDVDADYWYNNSYYFYKADRVRNQANGSLTKYASGFGGNHNLKFGFEFERSDVKSELGYPGGRLIYTYSNSFADAPYAYAQYWDGYLKDNTNTRFTLFGQDSWSIGNRLTINAGVRWDHFSGHNNHLNETVFTTNGVAPRIGAAFDLFGNGKTVFRAHYGIYFDGAKSTYYDPLDPQQAPYYWAAVDPYTFENLEEPYVISTSTGRTMDPNIKHPSLRQAIVGFEHELFPGFSLGATYIYRKNRNFIDDVLNVLPGMFTAVQVTDPGTDLEGTGATGQTITTYPQNTDEFDPLNNTFLITNPDGAFRYYRGVEITANKRLSKRWTLQGSWVISRNTGNYNNNTNYGNSSEYDDPNQDPRYQPLREGRVQRDSTHIAKVLASVTLPLGIQLSPVYTYVSGSRTQRLYRVSLPQGRKEMFIEERGIQGFDNLSIIDIRAIKEFQIGKGRLGVGAEIFNLFNSGPVTDRTMRSGSSYFTPLGVEDPIRGRLSFNYRF